MTAAGWTWDRFAAVADARGDATAIRHGEESQSFRALKAEAIARSAGLAIGPGDRVLVAAENSPGLAALIPAIWHRGGIPVMLFADAPEHHFAHVRATTEPAAVFIGDDVGRPPAGAGGSARPPVQRGGADPASILFTSGSTGLPKGVVQSAGNLIDGAARMSRLFGYGPDDRILCPIPFAFDYGWGQLLSLLLEGITLVMPRPRSAFGLCEALERHLPTVFAGVPSVFGDLCSGLAPIRTVRRDSVRLITNTGSKIPRPVFETLLELFPDAAVSLNYGLTETYRTSSLPPELARERPDSVGFAIPGVTVEIRRPDGSLAGAGEEGEIVHRGAGTFLGYWNDPARTAAVLRPHPEGGLAVHTGDLGRIDADGLLHVHGRRDRQLKSMGVRVSPDEVEALLLESGLAAEVAITALPHDVLGDMVVACIIPAPGAPDERTLLKTLKAHARGRMSVYMQPRQYILFDELPRTRSGKVDYPTLRAELLTNQVRSPVPERSMT